MAPIIWLSLQVDVVSKYFIMAALCNRAGHYIFVLWFLLLSFYLLVHGQLTIIFVVSVCLFVCEEFSQPSLIRISIKLGHMLYVWV